MIPHIKLFLIIEAFQQLNLLAPVGLNLLFAKIVDYYGLYHSII